MPGLRPRLSDADGFDDKQVRDLSAPSPAQTGQERAEDPPLD
jgi:hypothetical protein